MRAENVKVGQEYLCQVGRNAVRVALVAISPKGPMTVQSIASKKKFQVADAGRLSPVPAAERAQGATVAAPVEQTPKGATVTRGRTVGQQGAPQAKQKRTSLMDAAVKVLQEADQADLPMNTTKMVEMAMSKGYWTPAKGGKTPANTLYAMILRDMQKHGTDARFRRAEEKGKFCLKG